MRALKREILANDPILRRAVSVPTYAADMALRPPPGISITLEAGEGISLTLPVSMAYY